MGARRYLAVAAGAVLIMTPEAAFGAEPTKELMSPPQRRPDWSDEFTGHHLDRAHWRFETDRNAAGWYNGEAQYYAADEGANLSVDKGFLTIRATRFPPGTAYPKDWGAQRYASARISTKTLMAWSKGYFEVRAKVPCARGMWPAIWMLPVRGAWPAAGEIDIMEQLGREHDLIHSTLHYAADDGKHVSTSASANVASVCRGFHRYQMRWEDKAITFGVDDRAFQRIDTSGIGPKGQPVFGAPFYIILNLAVGGDWAGTQGIDDAALPQTFSIDYIRIWK